MISKIPDYDYVEITYIPTFNVTLTDAEMDVIPYSENDITIPVEFTVSEPLFDGMILDPSQITIERIMITAIAYKDGEAILADIYKDPNPPVRFSDLDVYIFSTPHGVFVSPGGADIVYMKYIAYLRDNGFITHTEWHNAIWRSAKPTMTDFVVPSENPKSLDEADESLENLSKASNEERSMSLTSATQTENIIYLPTVNLNYAIETLNGGNQIEISGIVQWTDIESNLHPARQLDIEINDNLSKLPCKQ